MAAAARPEAMAEEEAADTAAAAAALSELSALLSPSCAASAAAAEAALSLSGSAAGRRLLAAHGAALAALSALAAGPSPGAAAAASALLNVSAEPAALQPLLGQLPALLPAAPAGPLCGLLANLARHPRGARAVLAALGDGLGRLLQRLLRGQRPQHLGQLLCNISCERRGREAILDRDGWVLQRLLPLIHCQDSVELRKGVVGALRNCCFEHEHHEWLLSEAVDVLPFLLLPLAGPEELPPEDMDKLPVDLQYLPQDKQREPEPEIRKMLLETLLLLTATKGGRSAVRAGGTYVVLRELHGWESHPGVLSTCHKLIQVLIGDEPGPGMENLLEVTVPEDVELQLLQQDREEQQLWGQQGTGDGTDGTPGDREEEQLWGQQGTGDRTDGTAGDRDRAPGDSDGTHGTAGDRDRAPGDSDGTHGDRDSDRAGGDRGQ